MTETMSFRIPKRGNGAGMARWRSGRDVQLPNLPDSIGVSQNFPSCLQTHNPSNKLFQNLLRTFRMSRNYKDDEQMRHPLSLACGLTNGGSPMWLCELAHLAAGTGCVAGLVDGWVAGGRGWTVS